MGCPEPGTSLVGSEGQRHWQRCSFYEQSPGGTSHWGLIWELLSSPARECTFPHPQPPPGSCSLSGSDFQPGCGSGMFLPPLLAFIRKGVSVPGWCLWEELGMLQEPSTSPERRVFFRKSRGADQQALTSRVLLLGLLWLRLPSSETHLQQTKQGVHKGTRSSLCCEIALPTPSPEPFQWAVITCALLLDFSKVSLYPC